MFIINATDYAPISPVTAPCDIIPMQIGYKGENQARCVTFDLSECVETFGAGTFTIKFKKDGSSQAYTVAHTDQLDNIAIWEVDSTDTSAAGYGMVQLQYLVDSVVCKTAMYRTVVFDSLA